MIFWISFWVAILVVLCLALVCVFEFVNGSNDTSNAVSPIIYSHSLKPKRAVLLAATMNFLWVSLGWIWVAMGIVHLLPLDIIAEKWSIFGVCVVLALLLTAIVWNSGTWYLAIPSSSSHTLIGSIFWVGIAMSLLPIVSETTVSLNWHKIIEVGESLLLSPLIGFWLAFTIMTVAYKLLHKKDDFFDTPKKKDAPEVWLRTLLIGASCWVSFAHGSNDGQKWVGLATLILISLVPTVFAIDSKVDILTLQSNVVYMQNVLEPKFSQVTDSQAKEKLSLVDTHLKELNTALIAKNIEKRAIRADILKVQRDLKDISGNALWIPEAQASELKTIVDSKELQWHAQNLYDAIDYAPWWIIAMISISIGLGTMFWRKRIVKTLGKKIGNHKMNYAESTTSALITALTITTASRLWLPVSTTHIFSSSIAWCMMTGKKPGVQQDTIKHILLAWVLTLPSTITISGILFSILWVIFLR